MKRDPAIVSKTMSAIRGKDTGIEKKLRKALSEQGIHYRLYSTKVIGHPDILIDSLKIAIFCDSEFWHGYRFEENEAKLTSNRDYWVNKIRHNKERDEIVNKTLKEQGYLVLRFWGEQINKHLDEVVNEIQEAVNKRKHLFALREGIKEKTTLVYIEKEGSYLMLCRDKEEGETGLLDCHAEFVPRENHERLLEEGRKPGEGGRAKGGLEEHAAGPHRAKDRDGVRDDSPRGTHGATLRRGRRNAV